MRFNARPCTFTPFIKPKWRINPNEGTDRKNEMPCRADCNRKQVLWRRERSQLLISSALIKIKNKLTVRKINTIHEYRFDF